MSFTFNTKYLLRSQCSMSSGTKSTPSRESQNELILKQHGTSNLENKKRSF